MRNPKKDDDAVITDPKVSVDAAKAWTFQFLDWMSWVATNTEKWYSALVERIAVGACSCDAIGRYNRAAEQAYYWQSWMWDKFDDYFQQMRQAGLNVPIDPPLPKLIGTVYNVYGGKRSLAKFEVYVPCSPNGLADVSRLDISGQPSNCAKPLPGQPEQPSSVGPTWSGFYDLSSGSQLGITPAGVVAVAVVCATVAFAIHHYPSGQDPLTRAIGALDGSTIAQINAQEADKRLEQDALREQLITKCVADGIASYGVGVQPSADQLAALESQCVAYGNASVPDREPPRAEWGIGKIVMTVAVAGTIIGGIFLVTQYLGKQEHGGSRSPAKAA
jgi:hypothetical protein